MNFFITILLISACTTSTQQVPATVKFLAEDAQVRRDGVSYTTSVVHQNPKYPDQHAESTIKVDFNNGRQKQSREVQTKPNTAYQSTYIQKRPKSLPSYSHNFQQSLPRQQAPQYAVEEKIPQANQIYSHIQSPNAQNPSYSAPQSQSFNVGYSVSFTGNSQAQSPRTLTRQKLENAEIITGSRKDVVRKPNPEFEADDFVNNALIDIKKQKVSGIKAKPHKYNNKDNDAKSFINNLAPKTQQYLSFLGDAKPVASSNTRFRQQLQSNDAQNTKALTTSWTNLSPSVEIYHSKDVPQQHNFTPKEQRQQSIQFNHAAALGTSQGFDYSNALEGQTERTQTALLHTYEDVGANVLGQIENQHLNLDQSYASVLGNALGQTENQHLNVNHLGQSYSNLLGNAAGDSLPSFASHNPLTALESNPVALNTLQVLQKPEDIQGSAKQIPGAPSQGTAIALKLPFDPNFIREPVLIPNGQNIPGDPNIMAIPYDTRFFPSLQQELATSKEPSKLLNDVIKGQIQAIPTNAGITAQQFQGQLENLQVQPLQALNQNVFQDQRFQQIQGHQQVQPSQQFNVYGTPQAAVFLNNGFDQYFDKYFDKMKPQESRIEGVAVRHPKINGNNSNNNRMRHIKSSELHMDLRPPPPSKIARHRRMFKGK